MLGFSPFLGDSSKNKPGRNTFVWQLKLNAWEKASTNSRVMQVLKAALGVFTRSASNSKYLLCDLTPVADKYELGYCINHLLVESMLKKWSCFVEDAHVS